MGATVLLLSVQCASAPLSTSGVDRQLLDHQYYTGDVAQAIKAVTLVLNEIKVGVIGTDEAGGVVVSRPYAITGAEPDLAGRFEKGQALYAVLVVSIATSAPGTVEVDIATLLHAKAGDRGLVRSHGWIGANTLTQRVYSRLEHYLGEGHLRPLGS